MESKKIQKGQKKRNHPIFLGLNLLNDKEFSNDLFACFFKKLKCSEFSEMVQKFEQTMKLTPNLHITTLFIGKDSSKLQTKYYKKFTKGVQVQIEIKQLVYVPDRILTAIINFPDGCGEIEIENKHPHITIATGKYPAKMSNDVLEKLFEKKIDFEKGEDIKIIKDVEINGEIVELILIDFKDFCLKGQTIAKHF